MILLNKTTDLKGLFRININRTISIALMVFAILFSFTTQAQSGEEIYTSNCVACHQLTSTRVVGPGLAGVTEKRSEQWLVSWIKNSSELIASGDEDAKAIFEEYGKMPMPGYPQYSDEQLKDLILYIKDNSVADAPASAASTSSTSTVAASPSTVSESESMGTMEQLFLYALIIVIALIIYFAIKFNLDAKKALTDRGIHNDPHQIPNYQSVFGGFVVISALVIGLLVYLLNEDMGMINLLMFLVLPYVSFAIFIVGSIYRYTQKGFKVSSLSTQFIEGKKLFWGSQPFHWGIIILFFGHLIAFLFPSSILAWNGEPIRLLILEVSSFAFGLSALLGLALLVKRRLTTKTLLVVSNKMDMLVYTVLFIQIVSGLGVAFFVRWGSSWFSSVLTPYLRSIFSFNPDINAVADMPVLVQLHIISAFFILAIIPFSRFMHFLVAPIDYIWRRYQVVIWNWNPKAIRKSTRHRFGKDPRNH